MERLIQAMIAGLSTAGLQAVAAIPTRKMPMLRSAVVAVGMQEIDCEHSGMYQYLGMENHREIYGRHLLAKLSLEVFSPEKAGGNGARLAATQVMDALVNGILGMDILQIHADSVEYRAECECFVSKITVSLRAVCLAVRSEDGKQLVDFKLKGEWK